MVGPLLSPMELLRESRDEIARLQHRSGNDVASRGGRVDLGREFEPYSVGIDILPNVMELVMSLVLQMMMDSGI